MLVVMGVLCAHTLSKALLYMLLLSCWLCSVVFTHLVQGHVVHVVAIIIMCVGCASRCPRPCCTCCCYFYHVCWLCSVVFTHVVQGLVVHVVAIIIMCVGCACVNHTRCPRPCCTCVAIIIMCVGCACCVHTCFFTAVQPPSSFPYPVHGLGVLPSAGSLTSIAPAPNHTMPRGVTWTTSLSPVASTSIPVAPYPTTILPPAYPTPPPAGLLLSPAAEVIPHKLVSKIRSGQFIDMRELLADNISLQSQLESLQCPSTIIGASRPRLREVSSLPAWCYCFLGFMATMTNDPVTRDQLAYARLIIKEAQRHGGKAWLDYDRAFRQQMAADPSMRWNIINPSLLTSTVLGQHTSGQGSFCTLCRMVDHTRTECALAYLGHPLPTQRHPSGRRTRQICHSWNESTCNYAGKCHYRHVCSSCQSPGHKSVECTQSQSYVSRPLPPLLNAPVHRH